MSKPYLSVIIPVEKPTEDIAVTLVALDKHLSGQNYSYEILVVGNGIKGGLEKMLSKFTKLIKNLSVVNEEIKPGRGVLFRQGLSKSKGMIRLTIDSEQSVPIREIEKLTPFFKEGHNIVTGIRRLQGIEFEEKTGLLNKARHFIKGVFFEIRRLFKLHDHRCAMKCIDSETAETLAELMRVENHGYEFEMHMLGKQLGYRTKIVPVIWRNKEEWNLRKYIREVVNSIRVRWWLKHNKYKFTA